MTHEQLTMILHALVRARDGFGSERATGLPVTDSWREEALTKISQAIAVAADARNALAAPPAAPPVPAPEWVDAVMDQAQVFASAWSLVGGRFDFGRGLEEAEIAKQELRAMLAAAHPVPATGAQPKE